MDLHWLAVLGCLCVLAAPGYSAAVPTQDSLVIARSDDATTEAAVTPTTEELTTEGPVPPIKLTEMEVISKVSLRYAHTVVVARVRNPAKRAQEANFRVLLPETAFISGFVMTLDGKSYKAYVKEKEEAKQIYDDAVSHGLSAAHVTAKARDSNQFVVSVNVGPSSSATFNLTYEEMLVRRNDVYNLAVNLHPGAVVPKLSVTVHLKEAQKITALRVPEVRTGNEIDATAEDAQNSQAVIKRGHDDREATITFTPDLEEQKRLMDVYAKKSKESAAQTNRYKPWNQPEDTEEQHGVLGQFVVQYDVERPQDGEILVNDGYFVHFFAPTSLPPLNKYVVFVLDTSGSMMDRKIVQLKEAMQTILSDLNRGDYFSIVEFASSVTIHELKEALQEPSKAQPFYWNEVEKKPKLVAPSPATPENIEKAKVIISRLNAAGGTNIDSALDVAVNLIHKRTEWAKKKKGNDTEAETTQAPGETDDVYNPERMKTLEPMIIFLTDGDPTVGVTSPTTIINRLTEKNFGEDKATIFSLAFGEDADRKFLRKLSLRSAGFMRHIYEAADAALQLQNFYQQVSSPLLADVKFIYPPEQVKEGTLTKNKFRTFYSGSEVVVAGEIQDDVVELTPQVLAFCGVDDGFGKKRYERLPKAPIPAKSPPLPLERLWSYLTIKQLLDQKDATEGDDQGPKENRPETKALALALKYEFVTPLTSLVVVKPNATKAVDAESVDKPTSSSFAFAPQSINYQSAPGGAYPGFAYSSSGFQQPALPGAPSPVFASQALSVGNGAFMEEEPIDQYDLVLEGFRSQYDARPIMSPGWAQPSSYPLSRVSSRLPYYPGSSQSWDRHQGSHLWGSSIVGTSLNSWALPSLESNAQDSAAKVNSGSGPTSSYPKNSIVSTPAPVPTTVKLTPPSAGAQYKLQEFPWAAPLLNETAASLVMDVNGTTVDLKLTKDAEVPKSAGGDAPCASAVGGGAGVCVYLTRCQSARSISVDTYAHTYCSVNEGYAGVCCSLQNVDKADASP